MFLITVSCTVDTVELICRLSERRVDHWRTNSISVTFHGKYQTLSTNTQFWRQLLVEINSNVIQKLSHEFLTKKHFFDRNTTTAWRKTTRERRSAFWNVSNSVRAINSSFWTSVTTLRSPYVVAVCLSMAFVHPTLRVELFVNILHLVVALAIWRPWCQKNTTIVQRPLPAWTGASNAAIALSRS